MPRGSTIRSDDPQEGRLAGELATLLLAARGGRTRAQLAAEAGVHVNTLGDLEKGRANPTLAYLEAIGPIYGVAFQIVAVDA